MKILVLGGTGAIGKHLVDDMLVAFHADVFVTTRQKKTSLTECSNIHFIQGNAKDLVFLKDMLYENYYDVIVDFMVYSTFEFTQRYELLLNFTSHYLFFSSSRVYAKNCYCMAEDSPRLLDVSDDKVYLQTDEYALAKARQEDILKASRYKNYTIIRPYITYSEERLQLGILEHERWLYRALHGKTIVFQKEIANAVTTLTYAKDLSTAICQLMGKQEAFGQTFHITSSQFLKWSEVLNIYVDVLEKKLGKRPTVHFVESDSTLANYQAKYDRLFDRKFDNAQISKFVDLSAFVSPEEGLRHCLNAFLDSPSYRPIPIDWKTEARWDKLCGEHTPIKEISGRNDVLRYILFRYFPESLLVFLKQLNN